MSTPYNRAASAPSQVAARPNVHIAPEPAGPGRFHDAARPAGASARRPVTLDPSDSSYGGWTLTISGRRVRRVWLSDNELAAVHALIGERIEAARASAARKGRS